MVEILTEYKQLTLYNMPLVAPFGFYGQDAAAGPFDFVFVEKLTNIGSNGSEGPAFSNARNQDITYNSNESKWYIIATGGSTDTYHYDYTYPGKTGGYIGKANPRFSNRGIVWNGTEYVETYFQNTSGTKENPTGLAKYDQNTAGTGSFDLNGTPILGPTPPQEHKNIAYDATNDIYALAGAESADSIQFTDGYSNNSLFSFSTAVTRPTGVDFSTTYSKLFILFRDLSSGDGQLDMYDYDFDNPAAPNPATRQSLILSASDIGSAGGNVFRLSGLAVDNVNNNLIILHSNAGSGTTQNRSEGFVYSLNG